MLTLLAGIAGVTCLLVGALTLASLLILGVWVLLVERAGRRPAADSTTGPPPGQAPTGAAGAVDVDGGGLAEGRVGAERRARSWSDVPGWVSRDREWAVAVVLLGAPEVAERTHVHVDFGRRAINWPGLLLAAAEWPAQDRLLVHTAYDLALPSRQGQRDYLADDHVTLQQMLDLDDQAGERIQAALDVRRGRCDYNTALSRAGGLG